MVHKQILKYLFNILFINFESKELLWMISFIEPTLL